MTGLTLTLREPPPERVDASAIAADRFAGLDAAAVARTPLRLESGRAIELGELFAVSGEPGSGLRLAGDLAAFDGIARGMRGGALAIEGDAGRRLGFGLAGGRIEVSGDAGAAAGLEMAGGTLLVRGSVGPGVGASRPGGKRGMTGGEILVFGDAGAEAGACMRRGLIAVAGAVGPDAMRAAIAGTLVVRGDAAAPTGRWSKRGTVVALGGVSVSPTYRYACTFRPPHVSLLQTRLRRTHGFPVTPEQAAGLYERFSGDMAESGRGEILRLKR